MNPAWKILLLAWSLFVAPGLARASGEEIASRIKREPVSSTNVASIGYSRHLHALEIEFTRGATYRFLEVPRNVYRELLASGSKGHFIAQNIRGHYSFVRVRPAKSPPNRWAGSNH